MHDRPRAGRLAEEPGFDLLMIRYSAANVTASASAVPTSTIRCAPGTRVWLAEERLSPPDQAVEAAAFFFVPSIGVLEGARMRRKIQPLAA